MAEAPGDGEARSEVVALMVYRKPRHDWKEREKPPETRKGVEPVMRYTRIQCPNCGSFKRRDVMRRAGSTVHRFKCLACCTIYIGIETPAFEGPGP